MGASPGRGAGIACNEGAPVILGNTITDNLVEGVGIDGVGDGGGVWCWIAQATIAGNTIARNKAAGGGPWGSAHGGGMFLFGGSTSLSGDAVLENSSEGTGGGIFALQASLTVATETIAANQARLDGGIYSGSPVFTSITCSIVWGNAGLQIDEPGAVVTFSDVQGGWPGTGNIDADPQFLDQAHGDYSLKSTSPCIDAGDPAATGCDRDLAGNPRRLDGRLTGVPRIEMGAYEFDHVHLAVSGVATPGGFLDIDTTGTPGLDVLLIVGTAPGAACVFPYGAVYVSFASPWRAFAWGQIPSSIHVSLPLSIPTPLPLRLQELARDPSGRGNTSAAVAITIQ